VAVQRRGRCRALDYCAGMAHETALGGHLASSGEATGASTVQAILGKARQDWVRSMSSRSSHRPTAAA
jgi:hypothetical protein